MKKIVILLTAMLMLASCSGETSENVIPQDTTEAETTILTNVENPDFRNVNWGMSVESVIAAEGTPNFENHYDGEFEGISELIYNDISVTDYTATLCYHFEQDSLTEAFYSFNCDDQTDQQINAMYYTLYKKYVEKYGTPESASFEMLNPNYKDLTEPPLISDESFNFESVATYKSNWSNQNGASISMKMTYSDFQEDGLDKHILFTITYNAVSSDI